MIVKRFSGMVICSIVAFVAAAGNAAVYVSPAGSDDASGSQSQPYATWAKAQTAVSAGDTVYFRAGTYTYTNSTTTCDTQTSIVSAVTLTKSGSSGKLIHYFAYPGENPIFDFYGMQDNCRIRAIDVSGSWIHMKGLEIRGLPQNNNLNHENWGVLITGSNNIFELLNIHNIMGAGLFISKGDGNLVLNCDSYSNLDELTSNGAGESADGFGCHTTTVGTVGNTFRGCRAWWNADDGFDCISCSSPVLVENCWNWLNGYKPGTTTGIGNGNGFKMGGFGLPPTKYPSTIPQHTIRNSVAFLNRAAGFYHNHHMASNNYYNNTGYKNGVNFNMLGYNLTDSSDVGMGKYRNNVAYSGTATSYGTGSFVDILNNTWDLSITVANSDFLSVDTTGVFGPRKADGSLPDINFLRLSSGSNLIDKGVDVGLAYTGTKPDLGAYEYGATRTIMPGRGVSSARAVMSSGAARYYDISGKKISSHAIDTKQGSFVYLMKAQGEQNCRVFVTR